MDDILKNHLMIYHQKPLLTLKANGLTNSSSFVESQELEIIGLQRICNPIIRVINVLSFWEVHQKGYILRPIK